MSNTDSFIDEVSEELRRDQLFNTFKRYGWIAALLVILVVGGAAFSEYRKAQARAEAEALGDSLLAALTVEDDAARAQALDAVAGGTPDARALVGFLTAAEQIERGETQAAVALLDRIAVEGEVPPIYRQIAGFKSIILQADTMPVADRRIAFENLAQPGNPLRLLAEEQLGLIDIEAGENQAAIDRFQAILSDAELTPDLQQRALQVIVALGGQPELRDVAVDGSQTGGN